MASSSDKSPQDGPPAPKPYAPSRDEVVRALAESGAGSYEAIGGLGRDRLGRVVHLAREAASGRLVALRGRSTEHTPQALDRSSIDVILELDPSVPTLGSVCHRCGAPMAGWDRACPACGADLTGVTPGDAAGLSRDDLAQAVRAAVAGTHEVIGEMDRVDGGGVVYFARESVGGRLAVLWPFKDATGAYALAISKPLSSATPGTVRAVTGAHPSDTGSPHAPSPAAPRPDAPAGPRAPTQAPPRAPSEFTRLFGSMTPSVTPDAFPSAAPNAAPAERNDTPAPSVPHDAGGAAAGGSAGGGARASDLSGTVTPDAGIDRAPPTPPAAPVSPAAPPEPASPSVAAQEPAPATPRVCPQCGTVYQTALKFCPLDGTALRAPPGTDLVGQVIAGRYSVLRKLGEGGMGQVYLAEHVKMGRQCAIKVIRPSLVNDVDAINRFAREAANASRVTHPNVAAIYDYGEAENGLVYLAMEYVDGPTLGAVLAQSGALPAARAADIARQVAEALSAAHDLGIIHRDLKPDNIMLARSRDGRDVVKVVDFGIAKAAQGPRQQLTRTGFVIGTPEYMSPEQLLGDPIDGRSDIYSLGCILYKMLVGEAAFAGPSGEVIVTRRLSEPPPHPRRVKPDLPRGLDDVVVRALARAPDERFQAAGELRDALRDASDASPTGSSGGRRFQLPGLPWRRRGPQPPVPPTPTPPSPALGKRATPRSGVERPPDSGARPRESTPQALTPTGPAPASASSQSPERQAPSAADTAMAVQTPTPIPTVSEPVAPTVTSHVPELSVEQPAGSTPTPTRRRGARRLAVGAAAAVTVGALAFAVLNGRGSDRVAAPSTAAEPGDSAAVSPTDQGQRTQDSMGAAAPVVASSPAGTERATPPTRDTSTRSGAAAPRAPTVGTLRVAGELPRGATLTVDGRPFELGRRGTVELPVGEHRVQLSAPGYQPATSRVAIVAGTSRRWDPELEPIPAPAIARGEPPARPEPAPATVAVVPPPSRQPSADTPAASGPSGAADTTPATPSSSQAGARPLPPPAATPSPPPPSGPSPADIAAAEAAIRTVVANYGRAIQARSVARMRELYPDMSRANQEAWAAFITNDHDVRDLKVQMSATDVDVRRTPAEARLAGTITFNDYRNAPHTVRYTGRAKFRNVGGQWRIADISEENRTEGR